MVHVSCVVPPPLKVGGGVGSYGTPSEKGLQVRETLENDTDHAPLLGNYSSRARVDRELFVTTRELCAAMGPPKPPWRSEYAI